MAMDFFAHQEVAKRKTGLLVFLFAAAVVAIALSVHIVVTGTLATQTDSPARFWDPTYLIPTTLGVLTIVATGSLYRITSLRSGGRAVAELMGARLVEPGSADPEERRLLNVVEEMAIASGTPVPPVFVMDDELAINAFAAGYDPGDAVVAVTRGTLDKLNRDELQGVIAHEFSHVLNGDMRLNIRLMGLLHGIGVIATIGVMAMRSAGRRTGSRKNNGAAIVMIGLALWMVGSLGGFFAGLIRAAVSRQREFLADSSAVQFTRNPGGIGGALEKIAESQRSSHLESPHAPEVGHMLFGAGTRSWLGRLGATHPPIEERLRRIGARPSAPRPSSLRENGPATGEAHFAPGPAPETPSFAGLAPALATIGQPVQAHYDYAASLLASLPSSWVDAARSPFGARTVVFALLLSPDPELRAAQLEHLASTLDEPSFAQTDALASDVDSVEARARLPLVDLALPALHQLSRSQFNAFAGTIRSLPESTRTPGLFQWTLRTILRKHLFRELAGTRERPVRHHTLERLGPACARLLSSLAHLGHSDEHSAHPAFEAGKRRLGRADLELFAREELDLPTLTEALRVLDGAAPQVKKRVLEAVADTISHDHEVTVEEGELFRATAEALGCPVPPLLPGQPLA